ncbi:FABR124Cp [Eremothecium gossypii FDAG1]|nr:FABR124Cp [Eremothecium gossypii FDAG1]
MVGTNHKRGSHDEGPMRSGEDGSTSVLEQTKPAGFYRQHILLSDAQHEGMSLTDTFLYNHDLKPVEQKRRLWSAFNFVCFWTADSINLNNFQVAATGLQLGLTWWQCWLSIWIGYFLAGTLVVLTSRIGSHYHISFPVVIRSSFGIFFSLWPVLNRVMLAVIWYSVQCFVSVGPVSVALKAIFGKDLEQRIPSHINNPNLTTYQLICFLIFWTFSFPFLLVSPHKIRHLFTVKAVIVPIASIAMLFWVLSKSDWQIELGSLTGSTPVRTSVGWAFVRSTMTCLANFATLIINLPDFARFAKTRRSALWSQLISIPLLFSVTSLVGLLTNAAGYKIFAVNYWSPMEVIERILETQYTAATRAGAFFIAVAFMLAQLGTNICANSLAAGTDMTALLPRFINIRRGSIICAILAWCICPWNLMSSSSRFTETLSAYAIFLSTIGGVMIADYYLVRRGSLKLTHLYSAKPSSYYMYGTKFGINFRALAAYAVGIAPCMPGFIASVADNVTIPKWLMRVYYLNYWVGFGLAFVVYTALSYVNPPKGIPMRKFLTERGWYEKWAEVEDFEEEWLGRAHTPSVLLDQVSSDTSLGSLRDKKV